MRFKVLGINDDRSFCECCGKDMLKKVVWIEDTETGDVRHFGTTCALKPSKGFDCSAEIKEAIKTVEGRIKSATSGVFSKYRRAGGGFLPHPTDKFARLAADMPLWQRLWDEAVKSAYQR